MNHQKFIAWEKQKIPANFRGNVENHHIDPPLPFFTAGVPGEDVSFRDLSRVPIDTGCLYIDRSCRSGTDDLWEWNAFWFREGQEGGSVYSKGMKNGPKNPNTSLERIEGSNPIPDEIGWNRMFNPFSNRTCIPGFLGTRETFWRLVIWDFHIFSRRCLTDFCGFLGDAAIQKWLEWPNLLVQIEQKVGKFEYQGVGEKK